MNYRKFPAADMDVSLLGFGVMRMPVIDGDMTKLDEAESLRMLRYALDNGVNYIDTAYTYHGGNSEYLIAKALAGGYREKVLLATKMPYWNMKEPGDMLKTLDEQLEKLETDCIDMYLIHDIHKPDWDRVKEWKMFDFLTEQRDAGKIRFRGFSFHGESPEEFKEVLDEYPWDFCQLQVNYKDKDLFAGIKGFEYAVSKGVPVIIMEALKGGKLTDVVHPSLQKYWASVGYDRTPAEWALRWAANLPGVLTILSGMSTMEQVEENIRVLSDADEGMMSEQELDVVDKAAEEYRKLTVYDCTNCKYCMPCTEGINIPMMIDFRNLYTAYGNVEKMKKAEYAFRVEVEASACTACGKCEKACPQRLEIIKAMKETAEIFE